MSENICPYPADRNVVKQVLTCRLLSMITHALRLLTITEEIAERSALQTGIFRGEWPFNDLLQLPSVKDKTATSINSTDQ